MPARRRRCLDAEVGVGRALAQQLLGGREHGRLDRRALGGRCGGRGPSPASLARRLDTVSNMRVRLAAPWPRCSTSPARATSPRSPTSPSSPPSQLMNPQQLYELWERQNWRPTTIDFDAGPGATGRRYRTSERGQIAWNLSSFFVGEERVTTQFSGLVAAYETRARRRSSRPSRSTRPATRSTSTASTSRSLGYDGTFEDRLERRARATSTRPSSILFDEHLVEAQRPRCSPTPRDIEAKVDFVTTYHMVIEGTLALTGQYFHHRLLETQRRAPRLPRGLPPHLPGRAPPRRLRHLVPPAARPATRRSRSASRTSSCELLPVAAGVLVPPGAQLGDDYEFLGYSSEDMNEFAFTALSRRLKVIGVGLPAVAA